MDIKKKIIYFLFLHSETHPLYFEYEKKNDTEHNMNDQNIQYLMKGEMPGPYSFI